jgi:ribosomal protein S18 acetylase RimI-like enzyme
VVEYLLELLQADPTLRMTKPSSLMKPRSAIREAVATDCAQVAAVLREFGYPVSEQRAEQWLTQISRDPNAVAFVADVDGEIAGFLNLYLVPRLQFTGSEARITAIGVAARFRHLGIARSLVETAERFACAHGCARVAATTSGHQSGADAFYESLGYQFEARRFLKSRLWSEKTPN